MSGERLWHANSTGFVLIHVFDGVIHIWRNEIFPTLEAAQETKTLDESAYGDDLTICELMPETA